MPGINQLGGALTVASMNRAPATNENVVAPVPQENTSVQAAPADAVQGVRAAKDVQHESSDATSERQQRQSRKFKELAMRRTQSARGRRSEARDDAERADADLAEEAARSDAREAAQRRARLRLEKALNGQDLFSPRPTPPQE